MIITFPLKPYQAISMEISFFHFFLPFLLYLLFKAHTFLFQAKGPKLPPSPDLSLPFIGHLHLLQKPLHRTLANLSKQHGSVLFLKLGSRSVVLISSPTAAEECFTKNDVVFANRPRLLAGKHLGYNYTTLVWASYGDHWRILRRVAAVEILSSNRLHLLRSIRVDEVRSMIIKLYRNRGSQNENGFRVLEMQSVFFELVLNVMMRMIAGKRYYSENVAELEEEQREFKEIVKETFELSGATNVGDFLPILKWVGLNRMEKKLETLQRKRDCFMQKLIEEHRRNKNENNEKNIIEVLLSLQENEPENYTDEIIKGMMQVMLSAGTDTSSGTMEWALSLLLNNPAALAKARDEIDTNVGQNRLIEESDFPNLPYLNGIINETMRICPVAPLLAPHESSSECIVAGFRIPQGTMLLVNMWAIQNDPELWEDPLKFRPERFLGGRPEGDKGFMFLPFGAGRRQCPGEGLAARLVPLALGCLIQCFEWERVGEEMVDMSEAGGLTMPKAQPLLAKCWPRPALAKLLHQL